MREMALTTIILFFWGMMATPVSAQPKEVELEKLKAVFIYKFTNYIEWPKTGGDFNVGVVDSPKTYEAMKEVFEGKSIAGRKVTLSSLKKPNKNVPYDILYIQHIDTEVQSELGQLKSSGLLIITQSEKGRHEKAAINFYLDADDKLSFEIDNERAIQHDIKINSRLLNLSRNRK